MRRTHSGQRTTGSALLALAAVMLVASPFAASAQSIFGLTIDELTYSLTPTWLYNGFTTTADGTPVQGSQGDDTKLGFGAGVELSLGAQSALDPQLWFYVQEYASLRAYDKTVITQIETGTTVGDIAPMVTLALSVPWVYTFTLDRAPLWRFHGSAGLTLAFRIPIGAVEGSNAGAPALYWISGRFIYPEVGLAADYRLNERWWIGGGITWYVPMYNLWDSGPATPFLDETMIRYGLRLRRQLAP